MFHGSMVALVTPMREDGALDVPALQRLVDFHIENGTHALVPAGTTGESATLDMREHCEVIRLVVERAAGRIPVIAGTGANSTAEAIELSECAKQAGAAAGLSVTPYYNKPTQEGLYLHYRKIAEAVDLPLIPYNVPGRTACDMRPETVSRVSQIPGVVGIKEATGDVARVKQILASAKSGFEVYSGDDATALDAMLAGAKGVISVTTNAVPRAMAQMCEAAAKGDAETARAINDKLMGMHRYLFIESNPIPIKWVMAQMGLIPAGIRLPLTPLTPTSQTPVRDAMRQAGVL